MPKRKKKISNAKALAQRKDVEIQNYALLKGISIQAAKEKLETLKDLTSKLYSAGLSATKKGIKQKRAKTHKVSKFNKGCVALFQGGAPGLGKKK